MNINLMCPVNTLSYGLASLKILEQLTSPALFPISRIEAEEKYSSVIRAALDRAPLYDILAPSLRIFHEFSLAESVGRGLRVGFSFFEVNKFNDIQKHHVNSVDHMFVSSQWAKNIIVDQTHHSKDTVHIVSLGVDINSFVPTNKPHTEKTIFLNIGKWEVRKYHDKMATVFKKAFPNNEAELWMMPLSIHYTEKELADWDKYYRGILGDNVKFIGKVSENQLVDIINSADVGLFPYRSEAFCLPVIEMMACNKKIIATNYSGPTDYLTKYNSSLINVNNMSPMFDGKWFKNNGDSEWADPDEDHLIELLRHAHNNKEPNIEGRITAEKHTWANSAKTIESTLSNLQ